METLGGPVHVIEKAISHYKDPSGYKLPTLVCASTFYFCWGTFVCYICFPGFHTRPKVLRFACRHLSSADVTDAAFPVRLMVPRSRDQSHSHSGRCPKRGH
jgi:hypothetical protein